MKKETEIMNPTLQKILAIALGIVVGTCAIVIVRTTQTVSLLEQQVDGLQTTNKQLSYIVSELKGETR